MYIVRFIRKDGKANEDYYYYSLLDAEYHFNLFANDFEDLYTTIQLIIRESGQAETTLFFMAEH